MPILGQLSGGFVEIKPGDRTKQTPSPPEVEARRIRKAQDAMDRFIHDLNELVGRDVSVPPGVCGEDADDLTKEIYHAVEAAGIDYRAAMDGEDPEEAPTWVRNASRVVAKLRRDVPNTAYLRVVRVHTGDEEDEHRDPDAKLVLTRAEGWLDRGSVEAVIDLATCLLDYAFTRQGLDDELVRSAQPEDPVAEELKEEPPAKKILPQHEGELFVLCVKEALLEWKPSLGELVKDLSSESIYRIAMVNAGLPTGDALAQKCYRGSFRYKEEHPSRIVTIGHAALALDELRPKDAVQTTYRLETAFCRTCGGSLGHKRHGCCMSDALQQEKETTKLQHRRDMDLVFGAMMAERAQQAPTINEGMDYRIRRSPQADGTFKYEVHVKEVWADGIWQEVKDREAGERLAKRVLAEHRKAKALVVKDPTPQQVAFPQTTSSELTRFAKEDLEILQEILGEAKEVEEKEKSEELQKLRAQYQLGRSLKWLGVILCLGAFAFTGKVVFVAMTFVAWLMGHTLMDKKKIALKEKETGTRALPPGSQ